jgi:hypothetical protein
MIAALFAAVLALPGPVADEAPGGSGAEPRAAEAPRIELQPFRLGRLSDRIFQLRMGALGIELHQAGARVDEGFLWEKLPDRLRLSPRAAELADVAHAEVIAGVATITLSYVAMLIAPVILGTSLFTSSAAAAPGAIAFSLVIVGGAIGALVGAVLLQSGNARIFDAVNAYNVDYLDSIRLDAGRSGT